MVELSVDSKGIAHIAVGCDVVSEVVNDLQAALDEAWEKGCRRVEVDMESVQYVNSSGLSILVGAHSKLRKENGELVMKNVSQDLYDFFETIALPKIFQIQMDNSV